MYVFSCGGYVAILAHKKLLSTWQMYQVDFLKANIIFQLVDRRN